MTQRKRNRGRRSAFTLVELMVVITIIAILVALLTTAVMSALSKGPELQTNSEIGGMQSKLATVINNSGSPLPYLPSRLHLSKMNNYNLNSQLDRDSIAYLQARFGKHTCYNFQSPSPALIDWNGDGKNEELYLEGEQCLVFHLAGVPIYSPANTPPPSGVTGAITFVGFSNNPSNPALPPASASERRQGPYFEFQSNRLVSFTSSIAGNSGPYPVYLDPWTHSGGTAKRQPYAFFASYNVEGGGLYDKYGSSDCPSLVAPTSGSPVLPYQANATTFLNPSSFQIISAGRPITNPPNVINLSVFGEGGTAWGRAGTTDPNGRNNQSNFSAHLLGMAP